MNANPMRPPETRESAAAFWFGLQRSGAISGADARELEVWLAREPENQAAFDEVAQTWAVMGATRDDPEVLAMRYAAERKHARRSRAMLGGAIAASLAVAVAGGWVAARSGLFVEFGLFAKPQEQAFRTGVGQTTTVTLPDGSEVTLDTDTRLRTRETGRERRVELERGQAFFRVAKDASRPFIVSAAGKTVTATGTAFDVRLDPSRFQVTLVEGRVTVEEPRGQFWRGQSADMLAGWRLTAMDDRRWRVTQVDVGKDVNWMHGRLTFDHEPLGEVVAELNRYSTRKIVIADPQIAAVPIVGVFKPGDVDDFVDAVRAYRIARVASDTPAGVELTGWRRKKSS